LTAFGLGSCNKIHEEDFDNAVRSVTFQAQLGNDTRTGLALKFVPDWRQTNLEDVNIWEVTDSERIPGEDIVMTIPGADKGDYEIAYFKADFSNMTIIVNPPSNAPATRAGETYVYTSIVASKDADKKYTVPSTQYPGAETLIDPHADFLVGISPVDYSQSQAGKQVDIRFTRPVAISRLSIMNIQGTVIRQVKIYSSDKLTGSATYENVNFQDATVAFDNSGSNVITMDYGSGVAMPAEGIFNAYFVSLVGTKRITKVEVITNAGTEAKEFDGGKALTFKVPDFKSIAVNMETSVTPGPGDQPQNISFVKGGSNIAADTFDLYTGGTYASPTVTGAATGATLSYSSSDTGVATVSDAGVVTPVGVGETVISVTAGKVDGYQAGYAEYTLTVTDSTPEPQNQPLKFMRNGVEVTTDSFDLYNGGTYVTPTVEGFAEGATLTWSITCIPEGCATLADGKVTPVAVGAVVVSVTATAVAPLYNETKKSYDLEIKDSTPIVGPTVTVKLEEATELVAGEKYVLVSNGFALVRDGAKASAAAFDASAKTIAVPTELQENVEWTLGQNTDSNNRGNIYDFKNGDYFFGIAMNTTANPYTYSVMLSTSKSSTGVANTTIQNHNVNLETGYVYYRGNSSSQYIYYDTETSAWNNYAASNGTFDAAYGTQLYKVKDERAENTIAFSAAAAEYDLYSKTWTVAKPTVQNAQGAVSYESSDTAVATVDNSGAVTIMTTAKNGDTAVITAKAAGNDSYKPGHATYTISIVNNNPNVTKYEKVTSTADLEAGAQYLIVFEGLENDSDDGDPKVFDPVLSSDGTQFEKATSSALDVTINAGIIESTEFDDCLFTLEDGYYLKADKAGKYIYPGASGSSSVPLAEATPSHALTITFEDGHAMIKYDTRYIVWSTYNHYFSANTGFSSTNYATYICLYKLDDGRQKQTLTISGTEARYDLATSAWTVAVPTVSGNKTTPLSWESSNEAVATVDNSGNVTPVAKGTATITATAPADETYRSASVSFTVTVFSSDVPKFVKATTVKAGEEYLIVSNGYALRNDNSSTAGAEAVEVVNGVITYDAPESILWTATESSGKFTFKNDTRSLYRSSSNIQLSTSSSSTWSYDAANEYLTTAGSSSTYYFYYSTNNSRFSASTTQSDTHVAALYRLDDGTTPDPEPQAQTLSYTPSEASYDLYTKAWTPSMPTLGGDYHTTVTYESSDDAVVEVVSGVLTPKAVGSATITATAPGNANYLAATATCTITVTDSTPTTPDPDAPTYTQITSKSQLVSGATYLIVSSDYNNYNGKDHKTVFAGDQAGTAVAVSASAGKISGDYSAYEFVISVSGSNYTLNGPNGIVSGSETSGDRYIRVGTNATMLLSMASDFTSSTEGMVADAFYFYYNKSNSKEVLYLNSDGYYKIGGSGRKYGVYLYMKDGSGSTTPEPPTPETTTTYTLISGQSELVTGTYLVVSVNNQNKVLKGGTGDGADRGAVVDANASPMSLSGNTITITGDASVCAVYEYVITRTDNSITLYNSNLGYLKHDRPNGNGNSTTYIGFEDAVSTSSTFTVNTNPGANNSGEDAVFFSVRYNNSSDEYLYYNTGGYFKLGGSGKPDTASGKYGGVLLYKKN
jgi:uncharacterized protein YaiE (UPF0345 family)